MPRDDPAAKSMVDSRDGSEFVALPAPSAAEAKHSPLLGRLLVLSAAVMWSTSGLFAKTEIFKEWPESQRGLLLAFWRALFAGLLLLPFIRQPRWNVRLLPMGLCFAAMNATYLSAVTLTTAANAIWLQSTAPLWVFVWSVFALRQRPSRRDLLPLMFSALGIAVILTCELTLNAPVPPPLPNGGVGGVLIPGADSAVSPSAFSLTGVGLGILAGICYAGVVVSLHSLRQENPVWIVAFNHLVAALVLLPVAIAFGVWPTGIQWLVLAGFGLFQMGLPYLLFFRGLRHIRSQEASLIALVEPVLVPAWVFLVLDNRETNWWTLLGGAMILLGLVLRYLRPRSAQGS